MKASTGADGACVGAEGRVTGAGAGLGLGRRFGLGDLTLGGGDAYRGSTGRGLGSCMNIPSSVCIT